MGKTRRVFTPEFKQEAVRQVTELGRPISQVARELELRPEQLRVWKHQLVARGAVAAPVRVETAEEEVRLQFDDDGRGFDPAARSEGYGLLGMRERVGAMGGRMEVESSRGLGTTVLICLPLSIDPVSGPN